MAMITPRDSLENGLDRVAYGFASIVAVGPRDSIHRIEGENRMRIGSAGPHLGGDPNRFHELLFGRTGLQRLVSVPADAIGALCRPRCWAKLPLEFKTLAFGVHRGFDSIAMDAESIGMPKHTLDQLSEVLQKCVA